MPSMSAIAILALLSMFRSPPQTDKRPDAGEAAAVVVGCLHGSELKLTKPGVSGTCSDTVRLRGAKKVAKALREHEGHEKELTGRLTEPKTKMGGGRSKTPGNRTKITVEAHEDRGTDLPAAPRLDAFIMWPGGINPADTAAGTGRGGARTVDPAVFDKAFPSFDSKANSRIRMLFLTVGTADSLLAVNRQFKGWLKQKNVRFTEEEAPDVGHVCHSGGRTSPSSRRRYFTRVHHDAR
jgi:hypothetical protein